MKTYVTLLAVLLISISSFAQIGFNYKALIKDDNGNVIANQDIDVKFSILHQGVIPEANDPLERNSSTNDNRDTKCEIGGEGCYASYIEVHHATTDANGIFIVNVGEGDTVLLGSFPQTGWSQYDTLKTEIDIEKDGSFVPFASTRLSKVPMALRADYAVTANTATTALNVTGLKALDQGNGIGWRLIGRNSNDFGPIGKDAIDISTPVNSSIEAFGATGESSTAMGSNTTASGESSTAMGQSTMATGGDATSMGFATVASGPRSIAMGSVTTASGQISTAMGLGTTSSGSFSTSMGDYTIASGKTSTAMGGSTISPSFVETVIGRYNELYTPANTNGSGDINWNPTDRLFVIGNGTTSSNRSNALTVLKNGKVGIGRATPTSLLEVAHNNTPPTFEDRTNAFSIRNLGTGESSQLYTDSNGSLTLYRNGFYRGYFHNTTGVYNSVSDRRLKKDITPLDIGTLNKVMELNPVSYLMKDQTDTNLNLGLISQEVQALFPSITHYVEEQDILTLSYTELIPILIKALQEQQEIIDGQKEENISQNKTIASLLQRMSALEAVNNK